MSQIVCFLNLLKVSFFFFRALEWEIWSITNGWFS